MVLKLTALVVLLKVAAGLGQLEGKSFPHLGLQLNRLHRHKKKRFNFHCKDSYIHIPAKLALTEGVGPETAAERTEFARSGGSVASHASTSLGIWVAAPCPDDISGCGCKKRQ
jgi:hypothetical protein